MLAQVADSKWARKRVKLAERITLDWNSMLCYTKLALELNIMLYRLVLNWHALSPVPFLPLQSLHLLVLKWRCRLEKPLVGLPFVFL